MDLLSMLAHAQRAPKSLKTSCGGGEEYEEIETNSDSELKEPSDRPGAMHIDERRRRRKNQKSQQGSLS